MTRHLRHRAIPSLIALALSMTPASSTALEVAPGGLPSSPESAPSAPLQPSAPSLPAAPALPPSQPAPAGPIVPRPQPLAPRAFTLEDRYLDAARRGDLEMLKLCLDKGVALATKDGFDRSALTLAVMDGQHLEMTKFLHERGLPVDDPDNQGRTALGYAAGNGHLPLTSYLIEQGAASNHKDEDGQTPLFNAVLGGNEATVQRLLAAGAEVNVSDRFQDTPLIGACSKGNDAVARLLLAHGADPDRKDQEGRTARERAAEGNTFCREIPGAKQAV